VTRSDLLAFLRSHRVGVQASVAASSAPQAAVVGFAVSDGLEIVFDTLDSTRKYRNLAKNPRIAFVVGGLTAGDERTVQYEGLADTPTGAELDRLKAVYFQAYPDGPERAHWPGLVYVRVRPTWIRYSDFNKNPPEIVELEGERLRG
jgi:general stress protein 26